MLMPDIKAEFRDQLRSDLWIVALWEENLGVDFKLDCVPIVTSNVFLVIFSVAENDIELILFRSTIMTDI